MRPRSLIRSCLVGTVACRRRLSLTSWSASGPATGTPTRRSSGTRLCRCCWREVRREMRASRRQCRLLMTRLSRVALVLCSVGASTPRRIRRLSSPVSGRSCTTGRRRRMGLRSSATPLPPVTEQVMADSPSSDGGVAIGIDVGTQGARVIVAERGGRVLASARRTWPLQDDDEDKREQDPEEWWRAVVSCLREVTSLLGRVSVGAVSVAATSGTLVLADDRMRPVRPAMMWNDKRAKLEVDIVNNELREEISTAFQPGFTLPKALWVARHEPEIWRAARHVLTAGDWLLCRLTGLAPVSDFTNVFKSGYDLRNNRWPEGLDRLGLPVDRFPRVVASGTDIGPLSPQVVADTGLSSETRVVAGITDATAAQIASGAVSVGDWVSTIGTGLSIKGVPLATLLAPSAVGLYNHRHWSSGWIPTATSHCGADSIGRRFPGEDLDDLSRSAARYDMSSVIVLPLSTVGEYFPFRVPEARGFEIGNPRDRADLFRGYLEGIAFVERMAVNAMTAAGAGGGGAGRGRRVRHSARQSAPWRAIQWRSRPWRARSSPTTQSPTRRPGRSNFTRNGSRHSRKP